MNEQDKISYLEYLTFKEINKIGSEQLTNNYLQLVRLVDQMREQKRCGAELAIKIGQIEGKIETKIRQINSLSTWMQFQEYSNIVGQYMDRIEANK